MIKRFILRFLYKLLKRSPSDMEMVRYWKTKEAVPAKLTQAKDGSIIMKMEGEKYPFPTFPRGHLLVPGPNGEYPILSRLKHEIKNQIFNESWASLEKLGENLYNKRKIILDIKRKLLGEVAKLADTMKYEMLPPQSMTPSVREIHRAWTKVAPLKTYVIRDYLCFILQEDDGYRNRVQWLVKYFNPNIWYMRFVNPIKLFDKALQMIEHAETIGDMKERIRLLRRILLLVLEDQTIHDLFIKFCREVNWKKVALTKGDLYHMRGKYFKVDLDVLEY